MKKTTAAFAALLILSGCSTSEPEPTEVPTAMSPAPTATEAPSEPAGAPSSPADLTIDFGALGPVTVGMSKDDAVATGLFDADVPAPVDGCPSAPLAWKKPFGESVDVQTTEAGAVASLGVRGKEPKTDKGVGVGSTLADVKAAYGDDLTGPEEAGYGQSGAFLENDGAWIGFLFDAAPAAANDSTAVTFIEVTRGSKPGLMRDGC